MRKSSLPFSLFLIVILALIIRIVNSTFGSPILHVVPDEVPNYLAAFEMIAQRTLITTSQYPPVGSYILIPFNLISYVYMHWPGVVASTGWKLISHFTPRPDSSLTSLTNLIQGSANIIKLSRVNRFGPYIDILEFK